MYNWIILNAVNTFYLCFGLPDMFFAKQKLSVEIADIYGIKINLKETWHKAFIIYNIVLISKKAVPGDNSAMTAG